MCCCGNSFTIKFYTMSNTTTPPVKKEQISVPVADVKKVVENHKTAAAHHEAAASHHLEAAAHHEAGNHDKASTSTVKASGHHAMATEHLNEVAKHHTAKS